MKSTTTLSALALCSLLTACATVTRGTTEQIIIKTTPADATVTTSLNHTCQTNPCQIEVSRKLPFTVLASKPGYVSQTVEVKTKVAKKGAAGIAGNVLVGGVIGVGIDVATGAAKDHYPNPVIINLYRPGQKPLEPTLTPGPTRPTSGPTLPKKRVPVS